MTITGAAQSEFENMYGLVTISLTNSTHILVGSWVRVASLPVRLAGALKPVDLQKAISSVVSVGCLISPMRVEKTEGKRKGT